MAGKRRDKVYELDLHGKKLTRIEGLEKVCWLLCGRMGGVLHTIYIYRRSLQR